LPGYSDNNFGKGKAYLCDSEGNILFDETGLICTGLIVSLRFISVA